MFGEKQIVARSAVALLNDMPLCIVVLLTYIHIGAHIHSQCCTLQLYLLFLLLRCCLGCL